MGIAALAYRWRQSTGYKKHVLNSTWDIQGLVWDAHQITGIGHDISEVCQSVFNKVVCWLNCRLIELLTKQTVITKVTAWPRRLKISKKKIWSSYLPLPFLTLPKIFGSRNNIIFKINRISWWSRGHHRIFSASASFDSHLTLHMHEVIARLHFVKSGLVRTYYGQSFAAEYVGKTVNPTN